MIKALQTKVIINKETWVLDLKQNIRDKDMFIGNIKTNRTGIIINRRITWKVSKYSQCTLTLMTEEITPATSAMAKLAAKIVTDRIISEAKTYDHVLYPLYVQQWGTAENEVAITTNTNKEEVIMDKPVVSIEAKEYAKKNGLKTAIDIINFMMKELTSLKAEPKSVEVPSITTIFNSLSEAQQQEFLYEHMPSEALTCLGQDIPDPEPEDKMPIPQPTFDVDELKASLKAEILAELREELKASFPANIDKPVQTMPKEEKKVQSFKEKRAASTFSYEEDPELKDQMNSEDKALSALLDEPTNIKDPSAPKTNGEISMEKILEDAAINRAKAKARRAARENG